MNQKKAKAIRRAAKQAASLYPNVHNMRASYQDIVCQSVIDVEVPDDNAVIGFLKRLVGKKRRTKTVEKVVAETRTTVLVSGWRFIQQRLKAAVRRKEARVTASGSIVPTDRGYRRGIRASMLGGAAR